MASPRVSRAADRRPGEVIVSVNGDVPASLQIHRPRLEPRLKRPRARTRGFIRPEVIWKLEDGETAAVPDHGTIEEIRRIRPT